VAPSDQPTRDHGHVPVLLERCVELLAPALTAHGADGSGAVLVDATVGAGGHSARFLSAFPGLRLIGLDRDPAALAIAAAPRAQIMSLSASSLAAEKFSSCICW